LLELYSHLSEAVKIVLNETDKKGPSCEGPGKAQWPVAFAYWLF